MWNAINSCIKGSFYSLIIILGAWSTVDAMGRTYTVRIPTGSVLGICAAHDGGQLILLQLPVSSENARFVLRKVDAKGVRIWEKGLQLALQPGQTIVSGSIAALPNGKYAMTVIRNTPAAGGNEQEGFILQLAQDASIEWQKRFAGNHGALAPLPDSGFVAAGSNNNSVAYGVTLAAIQPGGAVRWAKMYSGDFSSSPAVRGPQTLLVTSKGALIFAAGIASPGGTLVFKTDLDGNLIWSKRIHGAALHFVSATSVGDRIILLFDQYSSGSIYLVAMNGKGDQLWTRSFQMPDSKTRGLAVAQNEAGTAIAGKAGSQGFTATLHSNGTLDSSSYLAAPISAPAFMFYADRGLLLAANTTGGGSMLFGLNPSAEGCSVFRSIQATSRAPDAVYVVDHSLTATRWNPYRGTSRLRTYTPSLEADETLCSEGGYPNAP